MSEPNGLPIGRGRGVVFIYNDREVTQNESRFINLTQMWEAAGRPANKDPRTWRRFEGRGFISDLARSHNVSQAHIIQGQRGKGGATWAHWQIAMAYAKHLSHEFHRFVNEAFREWTEEKVDPGLKAERAVEAYRRGGKDDRWIRTRLDGIIQRHRFTDALKEHGVEGPKGYALCTDAINKEVLGCSAKELKLARGDERSKTRDLMTTGELAVVSFAEAGAEECLSTGCAHGNGQCCAVCQQAGSIARDAWDQMTRIGRRA